jgi:type IV secretory pathway protease TraF
MIKLTVNKKNLPKVLCIFGFSVLIFVVFEGFSLRINLSASHVPVGIWRAYPATNIKTGDIITFNINDLYKINGELQDSRVTFMSPRHIKIVAGEHGAYIERSGDKVIVDGTLYDDAQISNEQFCKIKYPLVVRENHVWLMANSAYSYDSRYYGDIPIGIIKEKNRPLLVWDKK